MFLLMIISPSDSFLMRKSPKLLLIFQMDRYDIFFKMFGFFLLI